MRRSFFFAPCSRSPRRAAGKFHHSRRKPALRPTVEALEPRLVLNGASPLDLGPPVALENGHATNEDTVLEDVNVIADDTGSGTDSPAAPGIPLIVTAVNGQTLEVGTTIELDSGATLTMDPDGSFSCDPQSSAALSSLPAGTTGTDSFTYTVSHGFTDIISFGDSLSDVGRLLQIVGEENLPSYCVEGRFSNGPVWLEYLAPHMNLESTLVNNYAVAGATSGDVNFEGEGLPGMSQELAWFQSDSSWTADPDALYTIWIGPNDLWLEGAEPATAIGQAMNNIGTAVGTLYGMGARHVMVPNMVDLGRTPWGLLSGMPNDFTYLSETFNGALDQTLDSLEGLPGINVIRMDMFDVIRQITDNAEDYGFTNSTDAAVYSPDYDPTVDTYVFWDPVHPTTSSHELVSELVLAHLLETETSLMSQSASATVTIDVADVTTPPQASIDGPALAVPGQPLSYTLAAVDASPADQAAPMTYAIDWADGSAIQTVVGPASGVVVEHVYESTGNRTILVTGTDQDRDAGPAATLETNVRTVAVIDGDLYVGGTNRNDRILFYPTWNGVGVHANYRPFGSYALASDATVFAYGLNGNDIITAHRLAVAVVFDGGDGSDLLMGGTAGDTAGDLAREMRKAVRAEHARAKLRTRRRTWVAAIAVVATLLFLSAGEIYRLLGPPSNPPKEALPQFELVRSFDEKHTNITSIDIASASARCASGDQDGLFCLWNRETGVLVGDYQASAEICEVCLSATGDRAVLLCADSSCVALALPEMTVESHPSDFDRQLPDQLLRGSAGAPISELLASNNGLLLRSIQDGRAPATLPGSSDWSHLAAARSSQYLVAAGYAAADEEWRLKRWDLKAGPEPTTTDVPILAPGPICSIAVADGGQIAVGGYGPDVGVQVWRGGAASPIKLDVGGDCAGHCYYHTVSISPDGEYVYAVSHCIPPTGKKHAILRVWAVGEFLRDFEKQQVRTVKRIYAPVQAAVFLPQERRLLMSVSQTLQLWQF
jgi:phospholipase/lecithinase/hemolysin/WD40 repeat protein